MKKLIFHALLLIYVFIIPIYYQHAKESWIKRGNHWNSESAANACLMGVIWPFSLAIEISVELRK